MMQPCKEHDYEVTGVNYRRAMKVRRVRIECVKCEAYGYIYEPYRGSTTRPSYRFPKWKLVNVGG